MTSQPSHVVHTPAFTTPNTGLPGLRKVWDHLPTAEEKTGTMADLESCLDQFLKKSLIVEMGARSGLGAFMPKEAMLSELYDIRLNYDEKSVSANLEPRSGVFHAKVSKLASENPLKTVMPLPQRLVLSAVVGVGRALNRNAPSKEEAANEFRQVIVGSAVKVSTGFYNTVARAMWKDALPGLSSTQQEAAREWAQSKGVTIEPVKPSAAWLSCAGNVQFVRHERTHQTLEKVSQMAGRVRAVSNWAWCLGAITSLVADGVPALKAPIAHGVSLATLATPLHEYAFMVSMAGFAVTLGVLSCQALLTRKSADLFKDAVLEPGEPAKIAKDTDASAFTRLVAVNVGTARLPDVPKGDESNKAAVQELREIKREARLASRREAQPSSKGKRPSSM